MGRLQRDRYRSKLNEALSRAEVAEYLLSLWAVGRLQDGDVNLASKILHGFPDEAVGAKITDKFRIHQWEIETLANECLTVPRKGYPYRSPPIKLNCAYYPAILHTALLLRKLEDQEYGCSGYDVLKEMYRIISRQFEWQRGFFNRALFYRTETIYSHPLLLARIKETTNLTLDELSYCSFALYVYFTNFGALKSDYSLEHVQVSNRVRDCALALFSIDLDSQVELAKTNRKNWKITAYRPSVFRQYPMVKMRSNPSPIICPLPELIIERATSGLFYDVVDGSGEARNALGRGFESYAAKLLATLPGATIIPEFRYRVKKQPVDSPDFLIQADEDAFCIVECKANRLSFPARYGENPETERGYAELAKGVFQIWRFVSHCRRGLANFKLSSAPIGVILTLDSWLTGGQKITEKVFRLAERRCFESGESIDQEDKIPITFCQVADLEYVLWRCSLKSFRKALSAATKEKSGWLLSTIHEPDDEATDQGFPFEDLGKLLPWWDRLENR